MAVVAELVIVLALFGCSTVWCGLPKTKPVCSTEWGLWWNAQVCGNHPLHWAAASGDIVLAKKLLEQGHDVNSRDSTNWTPLNEAAFYGKQHLAIELVRWGANLKVRGFQGLNLMKQAKLKWCVAHSTVAMCPVTLNDYDMVMEVLDRGCEWTECVDGLRCVGRRCWPDKCYQVKCGTNAGCVEEDFKPVCRCSPGFIGKDPKIECHDPNKPNDLLKAQNLVLDPCPGGYKEVLNQCLYIDNFISLKWLEASVHCREMGGYLATAKDPLRLRNFIVQKYPGKNFWLGGNDNETEGVWLWESGEAVGENFPWGINHRYLQQPNNANDNEHCMSLKYFGLPTGTQYVDNHCGVQHYYICEANKQ